MNKSNLKIYREKLERLRNCLTDLQDDITDVSKGHRLFYAIDFSELYAYLNQQENKTVYGVGLEDSDSETSSRQHRLALEHLFNTLSEKLFILPPYVIEIWSYGKSRSQLGEHFHDRRLDAQKLLAELSSEDVEFLQTLNSETLLTEEKKKRLLGIVKENFEKICYEATHFDTWREQAVNLQNLFRDKKISSEISEILSEAETGQIEPPTIQEETEVFQCFPRSATRKKFYQKMVDSRAIIYLREINEVLARRTEKLLLITRDNSVRNAIETIADLKKSDYSGLLRCLRNPETVFFDLILCGKTVDKKLEWLNESINELYAIEKQLIQIINSSGNWEKETYYNTFAVSKENVLKTTFARWDERINLQLSLASKVVGWLGKSDFVSRIENDESEVAKKLESIKKLFLFIKSNEDFEADTISEVKKIWQNITYERIRIQFLNFFKREDLENIGIILAEKLLDSETGSFLLPPSSSIMPVIKFTSPIYDQRLYEFNKKNNRSAYSTEDLTVLIVEATTGRVEPEDFLLMAFLLGILELWKEAFQIIEETLRFEARIHEKNNFDVSQAKYFRGFIQRKLGENEENLDKEIEYYEYAFNDISEALKLNSDDPRYLKEIGAIILFYEEAWRQFERAEDFQYSNLAERGKLKELNLEAAKEYLVTAWKFQKDKYQISDDARLKIEILNNIIYAEVISPNPDLEMAEQMLSHMRSELDRIQELEPSIFRNLQTFVKDTEVMLEAKRAFIAGDRTALSGILIKLKRFPNELPLNQYRIRANLEHQMLIEEWIQQI
ncbi:MAG TPA: hypothetical protein VF721_01335 [Pyrinomonadaceae bacterium]|jgi:hypothetical protein